MAHHKSAKKRIIRNEARAVVNGARISRIRTYVKRVEVALQVGDKDAALAALKIAEPEMARGAQLGVLHKNTVARKVSRLTARIKAL
ncbi:MULTISPECIES: 30S ribosomal protein S20 [Thalassospira]|jgi:small subunit ribosomal protein S20|uniref:Small ribosomal subunit protein bS20 n=1 Tax=Thalassospira mesophila TaxID=1293891 RepID=A0A1Y2KXK0_9PROT|nr:MULTISPECIES: 30S ribosomal protein S20 [Thalassospira]OSQ36954.1 30S ribosomal protein S20 [Thalassospira mesophila]OSQ45952.1 30S ribosomal protein S20 [Thalassospira sp. MCCC 1A01428]